MKIHNLDSGFSWKKAYLRRKLEERGIQMMLDSPCEATMANK